MLTYRGLVVLAMSGALWVALIVLVSGFSTGVTR